MEHSCLLDRFHESDALNRIITLKAQRQLKLLDKFDRLDHYYPHYKLRLKPDILGQVLVQQVGKIFGYNVWAVNGKKIRNKIDIDFTTGGNPGRYLYVDEGQFWIEYRHDPDDAAPILLHEIVEYYLMVKYNKDYSLAHDAANTQEWILRDKLDVGIITVNSYAEICPVVSTIATPIIKYIDLLNPVS